MIDGTLVEKPSSWVKARLGMDLAIELGMHVRTTNLGVVCGANGTLRMASSGLVRLPDISFVSLKRLPGTWEPIPTLAPDLAVEVLSESNTPAEIDQKLREYFQSGTRLVWVIDPRPRTVAVYHAPGEPTRVLQVSDALDGEQVVPGFLLPVADLFRNVPAP